MIFYNIGKKIGHKINLVSFLQSTWNRLQRLRVFQTLGAGKETTSQLLDVGAVLHGKLDVQHLVLIKLFKF